MLAYGGLHRDVNLKLAWRCGLFQNEFQHLTGESGWCGGLKDCENLLSHITTSIRYYQFNLFLASSHASDSKHKTTSKRLWEFKITQNVCGAECAAGAGDTKWLKSTTAPRVSFIKVVHSHDHLRGFFHRKQKTLYSFLHKLGSRGNIGRLYLRCGQHWRRALAEMPQLTLRCRLFRFSPTHWEKDPGCLMSIVSVASKRLRNALC
jgi:hypothetical protein